MPGGWGGGRGGGGLGGGFVRGGGGGVRGRRSRRDAGLIRQAGRLLDQRRERVQELRPARAVDHAMIAREREGDRRAHGRRAVDGDHALDDAPDGEDGGLRWVEDGEEGVDPEHPEIRDQ